MLETTNCYCCSRQSRTFRSWQVDLQPGLASGSGPHPSAGPHYRQCGDNPSWRSQSPLGFLPGSCFRNFQKTNPHFSPSSSSTERSVGPPPPTLQRLILENARERFPGDTHTYTLTQASRGLLCCVFPPLFLFLRIPQKKSPFFQTRTTVFSASKYRDDVTE